MTREEAINKFNGIKNSMSISVAQSKFYPSKKELNELCDIATEALQKPKSTHWYIREYEYFTCSTCGEDYWNGCQCSSEAEEALKTGDYPNFCPNCGADMRGEGR